MRFEFVKRQPVLDNSPLKLVICQMRYQRQMGLSEADLRPVQRAVASIYPRVQVGRTAELSLTPAGVAPVGDPDPVFQFRSDDDGWTLTVGVDSMSLETTNYVDFSDFIERWYEVTSNVVDALDLGRQERIGLRYVDELPCPQEPSVDDIRAIVRPELVGVVGAHERTQRLLASMQELRFGQPAGTCALRHGLVAAPGRGSVYVLDMDFYDDRPQGIDLEQQARLLADFNHGAYEIFSWSVDPDLFATFKPRSVDA